MLPGDSGRFCKYDEGFGGPFHFGEGFGGFFSGDEGLGCLCRCVEVRLPFGDSDLAGVTLGNRTVTSSRESSVNTFKVSLTNKTLGH